MYLNKVLNSEKVELAIKVVKQTKADRIKHILKKLSEATKFNPFVTREIKKNKFLNVE